jgi:hypothetical protein
MPNPFDSVLNALNQGAAFGSNFRQVSRKRRIDEILGKYFTPAGTEQVSVPQYDEAGNELAAMMQPQATPARFDYQNAIADLGREAPMEALTLQNQQEDRAIARLLAEAKLKAAREGADLPSDWRLWLKYKELPDSEKPEFLNVKRNMYDLRNIAGVEHLVGKHPSLATQPLSTLAQEVAGQSAIAGGKAGAQVTAKDFAEQETSLRETQANLPHLESVANQLSELGKNATYTKTGQAYDVARRELGLRPREEAIARKEYISKVDNEVLPLLRATFGAAFTQKEGESLKITLGDPNATPEEKDAVLRSFINSKRAQVETQKRKVGLPAGEPSQPPKLPSSSGSGKTLPLVTGPDGRRYVVRSFKPDGTPDDVELVK